MKNKEDWARFLVRNVVKTSVATATYTFMNSFVYGSIHDHVLTKGAFLITALAAGACVPDDIGDKIVNWALETPEGK